MRIGEICTRPAVTCERGASARQLAQLMAERHVGDLVVVERGDVPLGIVTDRDLAVQVVARGRDPDRVCAGDLMHARLVKVEQSDLVHDAIWHMRSHRVRRLPVVDAHDRLVGVLTADDLARFLADELGAVAGIAPRQLEIEHRSAAGHDKETLR